MRTLLKSAREPHGSYGPWDCGLLLLCGAFHLRGLYWVQFTEVRWVHPGHRPVQRAGESNFLLLIRDLFFKPQLELSHCTLDMGCPFFLLPQVAMLVWSYFAAVVTDPGRCVAGS